ncbi:MAG: hypothetical protein R3F19_04490 [Verrucomicrobiales bacterium]
MKVERTGKMKGIAVSRSVGMVFAVVGLLGPVGAQDASTDGKLAKYKREHRTFTSKQGHDYKTAGIQKVTATDVSVITDEGVVRIKTADMPDDFRKIFGLNMAKIQEAQVAYARKKYDSKKAAIRKKAAQKAVQAMKARLTLKVVEEVEFGAICDAQFIEEVAQTVKTTVQARGLSRDQEAKTKYVDVKKAQPIGFPEKMLVRGLPKSLRAGSPWEGDVYMVGTYLLDLEARKTGDEAPPALDVPMAIVGLMMRLNTGQQRFLMDPKAVLRGLESPSVRMVIFSPLSS